MNRVEIKQIFENREDYSEKTLTVCGWIRTVRDSKNIGFALINDGSNLSGLQIVLDRDTLDNFDEIVSLNVGSSIVVSGKVVLTPNARQPLELRAGNVQILGMSFPEYPISKKRHTLEYLRTLNHLRSRTNMYNAIFRVRSGISIAIHKFFESEGFIYVNTPIISSVDAEGAGEMFKVTTFDLDKVPISEDGCVDYKQDFFQKPSYLTVSGQLQGEAMATALGKVYTFGPTFRAEKSYTGRHAAEFWMVEPEMSFADLQDDMELAEKMIKYVIKYVLENYDEEIKFFNQYSDKGLEERLNSVVNSEFERVTYTQAIELLEKNNDKFEFKVHWGNDLQTEHERYLTEKVYKKPVFVTDYPKDIKAFYMRNNDDGKTVAAMDLLVMGIGEIIGGSQREERLDVLENRMRELNINVENYEWYLDLRRYGTVTHSGFGLGFERLVMYITGMSNIRDVSLFPRTAGYIQF